MKRSHDHIAATAAFVATLSFRDAIDDLPSANGMFYRRECADVRGGIVPEHGEVRLVTGGHSSELVGFSETLGRRSRERGQDVAKAHSRLGHHEVFLGGIIVNGCEIISEKNRSS